MKSMKIFFKSLGKAGCALGMYLFSQVLVTYLAMSAWLSGNTAAEGSFLQSEPDILALSEGMISFIADNSMLLMIAANLLTVLYFTTFYVAQGRDPFASLGFNRVAPDGLIPVILCGIFANLFVSSALGMLPESWLEDYSAAYSSGIGSSVAAYFIGGLIIAPIVEELVFRSAVYGYLKRGMPKLVAALLSSAIFGFMHGQALWMAYAAVLGLLMCWVHERYGSSYANISLHLSFNLSSVLVGLISELFANGLLVLALLGGALTVGCIIWMTAATSKRSHGANV